MNYGHVESMFYAANTLDMFIGRQHEDDFVGSRFGEDMHSRLGIYSA